MSINQALLEHSSAHQFTKGWWLLLFIYLLFLWVGGGFPVQCCENPTRQIPKDLSHSVAAFIQQQVELRH